MTKTTTSGGVHPRRAGLRGQAWRLVLGLLVLSGCQRQIPKGDPISVEPQGRPAQPQKRDLHHTFGQPGFVYAYEQTSLYPKVAGYIQEWKVDIGDRVKKGQLLTQIYVPELLARHVEAKAQAARSEVLVTVAAHQVQVADSQVRVATADVAQAQAEVKRYEASVERWESEVKRLTGLAESRIVDRQILEESKKQLKADTASRDAAQAGVLAAQAKEFARKADLEKSKADLEAARAQVKVEQAAEQHVAALVSYTLLHAPYDGVVTVRNANTGDYVEPRYGDATPQVGGVENQSNQGGNPIYVVARTDTVRIYVDVPEMQAGFVQPKTKARVRIQSLNDEEIEAAVTRTSWALHVRSRTLRAEIDLPNRDGRLLPGMYAYGEVDILRKNVWTVPHEAVIEIGNQNICYLYEDGKAIRTPLRIGVDDGKNIEVVAKQVHGKWQELNGSEQVFLGDLPALRENEKVRVSQDPKKGK